MSLEQYAVHIAPRGGPVDLIVDEINAARQAALVRRQEYSKSKGAIGLYQNESTVSGLIFKDVADVPAGWTTRNDGEHLVAIPKAKDRTKEQRVIVKAARAELEALPKLPGAWEFTNRIGGSQCVVAGAGGRGFALACCWYERVGDTTFVMTPWSTKRNETGNLDDDNEVKTAFQPEGCQRVGLSVYYAAKEATENKSKP